MDRFAWLLLGLAAAALGWLWWSRQPQHQPAFPPALPPTAGGGAGMTPYDLCVMAGNPPDLCRLGSGLAVGVIQKATDTFYSNPNFAGNTVIAKATGLPVGSTTTKINCARIGPVKLWGSGC